MKAYWTDLDVHIVHSSADMHRVHARLCISATGLVPLVQWLLRPAGYIMWRVQCVGSPQVGLADAYCNVIPCYPGQPGPCNNKFVT